MEQTKYDVFISYRRSDSTDRAHLVKEILKSRRYMLSILPRIFSEKW